MPRVICCEYHETGAVSASALEKVRREAGIDGHHFTTLLAPGEYQMLLVDAPNVPANELKTAVRWKIKDGLSFHIDDATVDVLQIPATNTAANVLPRCMRLPHRMPRSRSASNCSSRQNFRWR